MADSDEINNDPSFTQSIIRAQAHNNLAFSEKQNSSALSVDPLLGTTIAERYQIVKLLGQGGMASVYEARHITLDKRFALKILHNSKFDSESIVRFQQEAKGLAALKHPNLVSISDFGLSETGLPYCAMDLVQGQPLSDALQKGKPLSYKQLVQQFSEICAALSYAHQKNIVHRDLKPSNIIICIEEDGTRHPKLIDFGIAKFGDLKEQSPTRTGQIFGSPHYMSPEQCVGQSIDQRSDIYSLGCTMYESFAGQPPFLSNSGLQTIAMHVNEQPAAPSTLRSDVPPDIEKIVLRCLAKNPKDRYQTATELKRDLDKADLRNSHRRIRDRSLIAGTVAAFLIAIAAVIIWQSKHQESNNPQQIVTVTNADSLIARIKAAKSDTTFNRTSLAALYYQLLQLKGTDKFECMKIGQEGYNLLVANPNSALNDTSYYSWAIASILGYLYFQNLNFAQAAICEETAINIFDRVSSSNGQFTLTPDLLEDLNVALTYYVTEPKIKFDKIRSLVAKGNSIWMRIEQLDDRNKLRSDGNIACKIFFEMGQRCEGCGDLSDAADCFKTAISISRKIANEPEAKAAEEKYNKIVEQLKNQKPR